MARRPLPPGAAAAASVVLLLGAAIVSISRHGTVRYLAAAVMVVAAMQLGLALGVYRRRPG